MLRQLTTLTITALTLTAAPLTQAADDSATSDWADLAESAQDALVEHFWDADADLFSIRVPPQDLPQDFYPNGTRRFHYWWEAHALDALVDGYERSGDKTYLDRASELWDGIKKRNGGPTNLYYDDMLWMGIALLRLEEHTGDKSHMKDVHILWEDIKKGWNDNQGGGIAWRKQQLDYKNTPANAPAVILAARLYEETENPEDLEWAKKIYTWLSDHLVDPETGFVWDGINRTGDGKTDKNWAFTYNQGVRIGAAVALYNATGEEHYLDDAELTYKATLKRLTNDKGFLTEKGAGDGGLFKGILIRYLSELVLTNPEKYTAEESFITRHAERLASNLKGSEHGYLMPSDWTAKTTLPCELSVQLSGVMLFEQMARLSSTDDAANSETDAED